jgi:hypothetical protein
MIDLILINTDNNSSDKVEYASRFTAALNYAKGKIARERYSPDYSEEIALTDEIFVTTALTKQLLKIKRIEDPNGSELSWERLSSTQIKVPGQTSVTILYNYLPADLVNDADILDLPISAIDPQILCFYAIYQYYLIEGGADDLDKSGYWLGLWNDGFENINSNIGEVRKIRSVYEG